MYRSQAAFNRPARRDARRLPGTAIVGGAKGRKLPRNP
jgi:hypothetical protein